MLHSCLRFRMLLSNPKKLLIRPCIIIGMITALYYLIIHAYLSKTDTQTLGLTVPPVFQGQWFLTRGVPPMGIWIFPGVCRPLHALQHGKFLNGNVYLPSITPVLILWCYMLFGLVLVEMEVWVKFLEVLLAEFELASLEAQLGAVYSACQVPLAMTFVPFSHLRTAWCT